MTIKTDFETPRTDLMAALTDLGYRDTAPRRAIASLVEKKRGSFTIEALAEELPSVGRATLYRTMKLFLEAGVVCKLATMAGSRVYSLSRFDRHHHHSVCVACGAVEEFTAARVERFLRRISDEIPGEIVDHRLEIYVDCGHCWSDE